MSKDFQTLRLSGVTRRFFGIGSGGQHFAALSNLSIDVKRGEFIVFLGPSGCGKSTALNCVSGLLRLSEGSIHVDDRRIDTLPPEERGFGMVFQNYALFPHLSVTRNVGFGLAMRKRPSAEIEARVKSALALVQLESHANKLPGQLSGGQQQRVAIARAIVIEPLVVLMDEPLSNLDAKLRLEMRTEIRRIHRELDRTTLYVTHDQDEALSLADRIVVMKDGVAQQIASPQEVYGAPANLHVARFMGYRNEWEAKVLSTEHKTIDVQCGKQKFRAIAQEKVESQVLLLTRPDDFILGQHGPNYLTGRVVGMEYYGHDSLFHIEVEDGLKLLVQLAHNAKVGESITVSVPIERTLAYRKEI